VKRAERAPQRDRGDDPDGPERAGQARQDCAHARRRPPGGGTCAPGVQLSDTQESEPHGEAHPAAAITQPLFAWVVSGLRARKVRRYYEEIGGGSPIAAITERQRFALEEALRATGGRFKVYTGMRYWYPLAKHAALEMREDGVARGIALPLYPHFCSATTGSSFSDLRRWMKWAGCSCPLTEIRSYPEHPKYVAALAETISAVIRDADRGGTFLLFQRPRGSAIVDRRRGPVQGRDGAHRRSR